MIESPTRGYGYWVASEADPQAAAMVLPHLPPPSTTHLRTVHSIYAELQTRQVSPSYGMNSIERATGVSEDAWSETHAALIALGLYTNNPELTSVSFQALRNPVDAWSAALWTVKRGLVWPDGWQDRLGAHKAEAQQKPSDAFKVGMIELELQLYRRSRGVVPEAAPEGWASLEQELLHELGHIIDNPEAFPNNEQQRMRVRIDRLLRDYDAGSPEIVRLRRHLGVIGPAKLALQGLKLMGKRMAGRRPELPTAVPPYCTFMEPSAHANSGLEQLQTLLLNGSLAEARVLYESMFEADQDAIMVRPGRRMQATVLMHLYQDSQVAQDSRARVESGLEELRLSTEAGTVHQTATEAAHGRMAALARAREIFAQTAQLTDVGERTAALLQLCHSVQVLCTGGGAEAQQFERTVREAAQKSWSYWMIIVDGHDPARGQLVEATQKVGVDKIACRTLRMKCGETLCGMLCSGTARMHGLGLLQKPNYDKLV